MERSGEAAMRGWIGAAVGLALLAAGGTADARPPVTLTRIGTTLQPGQVWVTIAGGLACIGHKTLEWSAEDARNLQHDVEFVSLFSQALSEEGFSVAGGGSTDLFQSKSENADLQVGALVTRLNLETCAPKSGMGLATGLYLERNYYLKGTAEMDVEWQVYSVLQDKVLARIRTHGTAELKKTQNDAGESLVRKVFADNARQLARSAEFARLVDATATPSTPKTQVARGELRLAMPVAAKPVPLATAAASVVTIFTGDGHGSGVLISSDGYILTNHHVAGDAGTVRVRWPDGVDSVGEVIRVDKRRDVALIKTTQPKVQPLPIRHGAVQMGETVFAIGTPLDKDLSGTLTRGVVSAANRMYEGQPFIQSDVGVAHGNSGGPLLDEKGFVIGLTDLGLYMDEHQGLNLFIPIDEALRILALTPDAPAASLAKSR
jgi:S1-C subfamily serine protease